MDATEERRPPIMTIEVMSRVYNVSYFVDVHIAVEV